MKLHVVFLGLALVAASSPALVAQQDTEPIRVTFAPPDGTRFVRTTVIEKGLVLDGTVDPEVDEVRVEHDFVWRRTSRGYSLTMSPTRDSDLNRAARERPDLAAVMLQNDFVIHYDEVGTFQGISGVEQALSTVRANIPPELAALFGDGLQRIRQGFEQQWQGRFALAEATARDAAYVGREWGGRAQIPFGPLGTIEASMGGRIFGWEDIGGRRCLVVQVRVVSEDPALGGMSGLLEQVIGELVALIPVTQAQQDTVLAEVGTQLGNLRMTRLVEETVRAIDPATYLTCQEQTTRTLGFEWREDGVWTDAGEAFEMHTMLYDYR